MLGQEPLPLSNHARRSKIHGCYMIKAKQNEYKIQTDFIRYLELMHPDLLYTISPAGFIMSAGMAMKMMRMGYRKGTPDVLIFEPRGNWSGFFIEFKDPKGKTSESQDQFLKSARQRGYYTAICYSAAQAIQRLNLYLSQSSRD
jgi:hypothetical protein